MPKKIPWIDFFSETETIISQNIRKASSGHWREDTITDWILSGFEQTFASLEIIDYPVGMKTSWSAFKCTGKFEKKFGDIAILVNLSYPDTKNNLQGIAFVEAKKRGRGNGRFIEMREPQESAILWNAPSAHYLLYDYKEIDVFSEMYLQYPRWLFSSASMVTLGAALPMKLVNHLARRDISLYRFCIPFSAQLHFRYFRGLDLEFEKSKINSAIGFADRQFEEGPKYLLSISIAHGESELTHIEVNTDYYSRLGGMHED